MHQEEKYTYSLLDLENGECFGIVLSALCSAFIIYIVLKTVKDRNIYNYSEGLEKINNKYPKINRCIRIIVDAFLLVSFFIMIAAFSAYLKQTYQISEYISASLFVLICYIVFEKSLQGMMKINTILVPILILFILLLGTKNIPYISNVIIKINESPKGFIISSMLYTSYNSILLIPVLTSMKMYITNDKQVKTIATLSAISIMILSFIIYGLLLKNGLKAYQLELPLIQTVTEFGTKYKYIYSFIIIASIFTSAISAGYSFLKNVSTTQKQYNRNLILICTLGIIVSKIGFAKLVGFLYPAFGILGILQIAFIITNNEKGELLKGHQMFL